MNKKTKDRRQGERPEQPKTPFLCASCAHGLMITEKRPKNDYSDEHEWNWEARCNNERIADPRPPETFYHPVVDCEGFESRGLDGTKPQAKTDAE